MARWLNIGGPCNPADHYMLSATERLPEVVSLINKKQYFVVHAPRQCGKTTAFRALMEEINAKGEMVALPLRYAGLADRTVTVTIPAKDYTYLKR